MGKMFAQIIAAFAEGELDTIQARALDASRKLREKGAWFGGVLPFGFRFTDRDDGGKGLIQDPKYGPLLRELYKRVMDGTPVHRLMKELNASGTPTWRDHLRIESGKESRGTLWSSKAIQQALMSPRTVGYLLHNGEVVEGDDGEPVFITDEPILGIAEWQQVVKKLTAIKKPATRTPKEPYLLTGVAKCGIDGGSLYVKRNAVKRSYKDEPDVYRVYTCRHAYSGVSEECRTACDETVLDEAIENALLIATGDSEVYERTVTPQRELEAELARISGRLSKLEADYVAGKCDGEGQDESYLRMHEMITKKKVALSAQIAQLPASEYVGTGKTFKEVWAEKGVEERRSFLIEHDVRVLVWKSKRGTKKPHIKIEIPDIPRMMTNVGVRDALESDIIVVDVNMPEHLKSISVEDALGQKINPAGSEIRNAKHPAIVISLDDISGQPTIEIRS